MKTTSNITNLQDKTRHVSGHGFSQPHKPTAPVAKRKQHLGRRTMEYGGPARITGLSNPSAQPQPKPREQTRKKGTRGRFWRCDRKTRRLEIDIIPWNREAGEDIPAMAPLSVGSRLSASDDQKRTSSCDTRLMVEEERRGKEEGEGRRRFYIVAGISETVPRLRNFQSRGREMKWLGRKGARR